MSPRPSRSAVLSQADPHRLLAAQLGHVGRGGRASARSLQRHRERQRRGGSPGLLLLGRRDHQGQGRQVPHVHEHLGGLGGFHPAGSSDAYHAISRPRGAGALHPTGLRVHNNGSHKGHNVSALELPDGTYAVVVSEIVPFTIYKSTSLDGPWTGVRPTRATASRPVPPRLPSWRRSQRHPLDSNVSLVARPDGKFEIVQRHGLIAIADTLCGRTRCRSPRGPIPRPIVPTSTASTRSGPRSRA